MRSSSLTGIAAAIVFVSSPVLSQGTTAQSSSVDGSGNTAAKMDQHAMTMRGSPEAEKAPFDHQFIDTMSKHHQDAIEMAKLVDKRSSRAELKQMANKMIHDQQNEIKQLQSWKEKSYPGKGDAVNMKIPGMMESMKGMSMDKLAASTGEAFDAMFIDMMSKHHQGAVTMAEAALKKAQHAEIKDLAKKVIEEQKKEIAQLGKWKKEWKLANK